MVKQRVAGDYSIRLLVFLIAGPPHQTLSLVKCDFDVRMCLGHMPAHGAASLCRDPYNKVYGFCRPSATAAHRCARQHMPKPQP